MSTVSLVEFLTARLDEDEEVVQAASRAGGSSWPTGQGDRVGPTLAHARRHDPARVLREIEAKRGMMAVHRPYDTDPEQACLGCAGGIEWERCPVLRHLAWVYAAHSDYQESWRP